MLDYNKLRTFTHVAAYGSVSQAAAYLFRTQSAISQQLRSLEEDLGFKLFERRGHSMQLTPEAKLFYDKILLSFEDIDQAVAEIHGVIGDPTGLIRVGVTPSIGEYFLVPQLSKFSTKFPGISVEVVYAPDEEIERRLWDNQLDFGLIIEFQNRERFVTRELISYAETPVCSSKYKAQLEDRVGKSLKQFHQIKEVNFIDFDMELSNIRHWLKKNTAKTTEILRGVTPVVVVENYQAIKQILMANGGVAMLPEYMQDRHTVPLYPKAKPTKVGVDFCWKPNLNQKKIFEIFEAFVSKEVSNLT